VSRCLRAKSGKGRDGNDGGDTTFGLAGSEPLLRAKSGKGGLVGTGKRSISEKVTVSSLMLANYVEFSGVFGYITGACFQHYNVLNLGDGLSLTGIAVLEFGGTSVGEYGITVAALDPENNEVSPVKLAVNISKAGDILRIACNFNVRVTVNAFGM